jgi:hypothetical protein
MNKVLFAIVLALAALLFYQMTSTAPDSATQPRLRRPPAPPKVTLPPVANQPLAGANAALPVAAQALRPTSVPGANVHVSGDKRAHQLVMPYKLVHGLIMIQGDQVVGAPTEPEIPASGSASLSPLKLWPNGNVPFHIQPSLPQPERVLQALAMFDGSNVHFTPYNGEEDALVFEPGDENCYSYVGRMGGKQPLWISPSCSAPDIAHEVMHALGFIHEQNRSDRDSALIMHPENIDELFQINFEKMPSEYMKVSGLGEFDYQSLMMYPPWMFSKNGQSTMDPQSRDQLIQPSSRPNAGDLERINRAYPKGEK